MTTRLDKAEAAEVGVDALVRIASARDAATRQSNRFLLAGIFSTLFYAIKIAGLRIDIVIADAKIFETPYGLFVFGAIGSICFILAQLRYLDGRAFDYKLRRAAKANEEFNTRYDSFPSEHNWLLPASEVFADQSSSRMARMFFNVLGLIAFLLYSVPLLASAHFLLSWPSMAGEDYTSFQWWLVFLLFTVAVLTCVLSQWVDHSKER
jgi:hypothetical protein